MDASKVDTNSIPSGLIDVPYYDPTRRKKD